MKYVETTIRIEAPPEAVLRAFTDVDSMREWWGADRGLVESRPGGVWALAWERSDQGFRYVETGRIAVIKPGRRLLISGLTYFSPDHAVLGPMSLSVDVTPDSEASVLTIRQDGYQDGPDWDWYYESVRSAWPEVAKLIKNFLEKP